MRALLATLVLVACIAGGDPVMLDACREACGQGDATHVMVWDAAHKEWLLVPCYVVERRVEASR